MSRSIKLKLSKLVNKVKDFEHLENAVAQQKAMLKSYNSLIHKQREADTCVTTWMNAEEPEIQSFMGQVNDQIERWYIAQGEFNKGYEQFVETWVGVLAQEKEVVPLQKSFHAAEDDQKKKEKNIESAKKKPDWDLKRGQLEKDLHDAQENVKRAHEILEKKLHDVEVYKVENAHRAYADLAHTHLQLLREGRDIFVKMLQVSGGTPPPAPTASHGGGAAMPVSTVPPGARGGPAAARRMSASSASSAGAPAEPPAPAEPSSDPFASSSSAAKHVDTTAAVAAAAAAVAAAESATAPAGGERQGKVRALYEYAGNEEEGDLSFKAGDVIATFGEKDENGWWFGRLNGKEGNVPSNYVEEMP